MIFVTIQIRLICQKWDLIETESEMYKSQMYGHKAGQPILPYLVIKENVQYNDSDNRMISHEMSYSACFFHEYMFELYSRVVSNFLCS